MLSQSNFCYTESEENEATRETVPTVVNWEDVGYDTGICYKDFVNIGKGLAVKKTDGCGNRIWF